MRHSPDADLSTSCHRPLCLQATERASRTLEEIAPLWPLFTRRGDGELPLTTVAVAMLVKASLGDKFDLNKDEILCGDVTFALNQEFKTLKEMTETQRAKSLNVSVAPKQAQKQKPLEAALKTFGVDVAKVKVVDLRKELTKRLSTTDEAGDAKATLAAVEAFASVIAEVREAAGAGDTVDGADGVCYACHASRLTRLMPHACHACHACHA